jgi:serine/threonine protein kinase
MPSSCRPSPISPTPHHRPRNPLSHTSHLSPPPPLSKNRRVLLVDFDLASPMLPSAAASLPQVEASAASEPQQRFWGTAEFVAPEVGRPYRGLTGRGTAGGSGGWGRLAKAPCSGAGGAGMGVPAAGGGGGGGGGEGGARLARPAHLGARMRAMAPPQVVEGGARAGGPAADWWALGVLTYEAALGSRWAGGGGWRVGGRGIQGGRERGDKSGAAWPPMAPTGVRGLCFRGGKNL